MKITFENWINEWVADIVELDARGQSIKHTNDISIIGQNMREFFIPIIKIKLTTQKQQLIEQAETTKKI